MIALVAWVAFVCSVTLGYPHGGRTIPVNKRSDFSMYDNQFFDVGDTPLDNEVTDCALVQHQYARGYIRLREYLERMEGCGIKGKTKNIAGIAASTKDATDLPQSVIGEQQNTVAKTAAFKLHPIGEVLQNANHQRPRSNAYQNQGLKTLPMTNQQGVQKSKMFNNFGFVTHENGPLSYLPNPAVSAVQSPLVRKLITRKNMDIPQSQALQNLNRAKSKKWPNPQRYYSDQASALAQAYAAPSVTVSQPLAKPNPFPLAFHQQVKATSANVPQAFRPANPDLNIDKPAKTVAYPQGSIISLPNQQQAFQPANPDLNINRKMQSVVKPVKQVSKVQSGKMRDDINGDQVIDDSMQDEANEATIDNEESDPLPPETSFDYNPNLEEEDSSQKADAKAEADNSAGSNLPNHPGSSIPSNNLPHDVQIAPADIVAGPEQKAKKPNNNMLQHKGGETSHTSPKVVLNAPKPAKPVIPPPQSSQPVSYGKKPKPIKGDDLSGGSEMSKLDEFLKPASTTSDVEPSKADESAMSEAEKDVHDFPPKAESISQAKKPGSLAINLDVLKNRISSSKDIGFLKRMLTLIKKITHHKDFSKLGGVQKNAIVQAGRAVHNAVVKNDGKFDQRSSIAPRPMGWLPGQYTTQGYINPSYGTTFQQAPAQRSYVQSNPPKWKPGDYTAYSSYPSYPSYQSSLKYHPPHWKPGYYTMGTATARTQISQPKQPKATKKFHIERNQYYQIHPQRPAYRPPYNSLGRLSFGLYNGNTP